MTGPAYLETKSIAHAPGDEGDDVHALQSISVEPIFGSSTHKGAAGPDNADIGGVRVRPDVFEVVLRHVRLVGKRQDS
jgi:hypothetical protein